MTGRFELGARLNEGDGETATGNDLATEAGYVNPVWGLEMSGRTGILRAHERSGYLKWKVSPNVKYAFGTDGCSLGLSLEPVWNVQQARAAEPLWSGTVPVDELGDGNKKEAKATVKARLGYGIGAMRERLLAIPYGETEMVGSSRGK